LKFEGLTFVEAVHQIASSLGLTVPNEHIADTKKDKRKFLGLRKQ